MNNKKRIVILDAVRGFAIVLMVAHHLGYDLVYELGVVPRWVLENDIFYSVHFIFAGLFILLSGASSRFSRSNFKRGLQMAAVAIGITIVTYLFGTPIYIGIIHFLALSTLLYAVLRPLIEKIPDKIQPFLFGALILPCYLLLQVQGPSWLFWLGIGSGPYSYDYFPVLKWLFIYLLGSWFGGVISAGKLPKWFYDFKLPVLPWIGRNSLLIYLVHQPVLFGIWWLIGK